MGGLTAVSSEAGTYQYLRQAGNFDPARLIVLPINKRECPFHLRFAFRRPAPNSFFLNDRGPRTEDRAPAVSGYPLRIYKTCTLPTPPPLTERPAV